jgi:predicted benzoate:H+ symporter BenE
MVPIIVAVSGLTGWLILLGAAIAGLIAGTLVNRAIARRRRK